MSGSSLKMPDLGGQGLDELLLLIKHEGELFKCWAEGDGDPRVEVDGGGYF